jgi:hypothetical protein
MDFLRSDIAKVIGACLASVAGVLLATYPPPNMIGTVASVVVAVLAGLGLVSGGTKGNQPTNVTTNPPAP